MQNEIEKHRPIPQRTAIAKKGKRSIYFGVSCQSFSFSPFLFQFFNLSHSLLFLFSFFLFSLYAYSFCSSNMTIFLWGIPLVGYDWSLRTYRWPQKIAQSYKSQEIKSTPEKPWELQCWRWPVGWRSIRPQAVLFQLAPALRLVPFRPPANCVFLSAGRDTVPLNKISDALELLPVPGDLDLRHFSSRSIIVQEVPPIALCDTKEA